MSSGRRFRVGSLGRSTILYDSQFFPGLSGACVPGDPSSIIGWYKVRCCRYCYHLVQYFVHKYYTTLCSTFLKGLPAQSLEHFTHTASVMVPVQYKAGCSSLNHFYFMFPPHTCPALSEHAHSTTFGLLVGASLFRLNGWFHIHLFI